MPSKHSVRGSSPLSVILFRRKEIKMNIQEELDFSTIRIPNENEVLVVKPNTPSFISMSEIHNLMTGLKNYMDKTSGRSVTFVFLPEDLSIEIMPKDDLRQRLQRILDNL